MATKKAKTYDLAAVIAERLEKHPDITVPLPDGTDVHIRAPQSWDSKLTKLAREESPDFFAAAFVESDGADRFEAAGGSLADFNTILERYTGVTLPESTASTGS